MFGRWAPAHAVYSPRTLGEAWGFCGATLAKYSSWEGRSPAAKEHRLRIIDMHTHVWPDAVAEKAVPALEAKGTLTAIYDGTVKGLVAAMGTSGVDVSVTQPVATKASQVVGINDWAARTASDRIVPFGAIHPEFEDPAAEIARIAALGMKGFKLHPEHQAFAPDEPRMEAIYQAAVEHGLIVFFHAGADELHETVRGTPQAFARVLDCFTMIYQNKGKNRGARNMCWLGFLSK